jgi:hypothetical protein
VRPVFFVTVQTFKKLEFVQLNARRQINLGIIVDLRCVAPHPKNGSTAKRQACVATARLAKVLGQIAAADRPVDIHILARHVRSLPKS